MYRKRETKIADAIRTDSSRDRVFSYVVLFVISLVTVIIGYILWGLIAALTVNMDRIVSNMDSLTRDVNTMSKDINTISVHIKHMDHMDSISADINDISKDISTMTTSIQKMQDNTQNMKGDMKDLNKLNPMRVF